MPTKSELKDPDKLVEAFIKAHQIENVETIKYIRGLATVIKLNYTLIPK